jgi:hypothetical protein
MGYFYLTSYIQSGIFTVEIVMKNQFEKKCCWCKVVVPAYEGKCWNYNGKWFVGCQSCLDEKFKKDDKGD